MDLSVPVPPAPREPSASARQLIFRYTGSQAAFLWMGLAFMVMGVPFVVGFNWGVWRDVAMAFNGTKVQARLLGAELNRSVTINDEHPTTLRYAYEVGGVAYEGETDVLDPKLSESPRGAPVEVEYATSRPEWSRIVGERASFFGYYGLFALLFPVIGAVFFTKAVRSNRREIRAFVHGTPVMARVTFAGSDQSVTVNGRHPFEVRWEFEAEGQTWTGSLSSMDRALMARLAEQAAGELVVLYAPGDPATNTLWLP